MPGEDTPDTDGRVRREPWLWTWTDQDGIERQAKIHYTRDDRSVVFDPRYPGDPEPWFDADTVNWRCGDEDIVTLGDPDSPYFGIVDPDEDDEPPPVIQDITRTDQAPGSPAAGGTALPTDSDTPNAAPAPAAGRSHVKEEPPRMLTNIPEVTNHSSLLKALAVVRAEVESRQEDVQNLYAWNGEMAARLEGMAAELQQLNVDQTTIANIAYVGDGATEQAQTASRYASLTDTSVQQAEIASRTANRNHGRIQDAVDDSDVPMAKPKFYNAGE